MTTKAKFKIPHHQASSLIDIIESVRRTPGRDLIIEDGVDCWAITIPEDGPQDIKAPTKTPSNLEFGILQVELDILKKYLGQKINNHNERIKELFQASADQHNDLASTRQQVTQEIQSLQQLGEKISARVSALEERMV